ncbi:MFS transporter [Paracnuella aquatica]|uniref:MFS transporter n=1 Tax=Paracnuella aquatica TaxID=2268757 RepID=UPI000DF00EB7|nr:MFS transporter [Paracnuella aquatica]RPD48277.1 MFS transporter [Paracnuella aquatica]
MQQTAPKKVVNAWALYDWANSAYNLVITSTIFPAYFEAITGDGNEATVDRVSFMGRSFLNTALYNYALGVAFIVVALVSPLLSSIADTRGNKKNFLAFFMTMGSLACSALFFFTPGRLALGIACLIIACIGYWGSLVFYNSFLPEIAAPQDRDRVSAKGFAYGYVGSVLLQIICFVFVFKPELLGGDEASTIQFRFSFLLTGLWWFGFAQVPLRRLPRYQMHLVDPKRSALINGYLELRTVWQQLKRIKVLKRYLTAFFFYNMAVQTIMLSAALYAKSELQIPTTNLIIAIVLIQLIAIPGAYIISWLSGKIGNIKALMVCVFVWIINCIIGYYVPTHGVYEFYALAAAIGFVMGGVQSLSRSTYAKLMPETKDTTSFFSFYDVTEKICIVIGMFSFGYLTELTGSQRTSVLALVVFFIVGLLLLLHTLRTQKRESEVQLSSVVHY